GHRRLPRRRGRPLRVRPVLEAALLRRALLRRGVPWPWRGLPEQRGRGGGPADAGMTGPHHSVRRAVRDLAPFDARRAHLLRIAAHAEPLAIAQAGGPSAGDGDDVVAVAEGSVAVRPAT